MQVRTLRLTENMRVATAVGNDAADIQAYSEYLLEIGDGAVDGFTHKGNDDYIIMDDRLLVHSLDELIDFVFPNLADATLYASNAILTPKNDIVDAVNSKIIGRVPGKEAVYMSTDEAATDTGMLLSIVHIILRTPFNPFPLMQHRQSTRPSC